MKSPFNFFPVVFLLLVTSFPLLSQAIEDLEGTWMGSYTCRQGETGMRMRIQVQTDSSFVGTFEFFPICTNYASHVEIGKYYFTGKFNSSKSISFDFNYWILKPDGWTYVNKIGALIDTESLSGKVLDEDCGEFFMKKMDE